MFFNGLKKSAVFLLFGALSAFAQTGSELTFNLYQAKSMSSDAVVLSLKQPTSNIRTVSMVAAVLECPSATRLTIEIDCSTAPTTTATAPTPVGAPRTTPTVLGYINSNAASCTTIASAYVAANVPTPIDLSGIYLTRFAGENITMRSGTVTSGTCYAWLVGKEE